MIYKLLFVVGANSMSKDSISGKPECNTQARIDVFVNLFSKDQLFVPYIELTLPMKFIRVENNHSFRHRALLIYPASLEMWSSTIHIEYASITDDNFLSFEFETRCSKFLGEEKSFTPGRPSCESPSAATIVTTALAYIAPIRFSCSAVAVNGA